MKYTFFKHFNNIINLKNRVYCIFYGKIAKKAYFF